MKEGWEYKKLGEVCETCSGGTPSKSHPEYYEGGTIPWLRSGEISQGLIYKTELFITEEGLNKSSAKMIPVDTVSIAMYGATIGQVGIIKTPMCTNQAICNILPNDIIFPLFLKLFLQSKKEKFVSLGAGGAQPNISQNIIRDTLIPLPPLSEQQTIVAELDKINEIIDLKKAQLKDLDLLAQSIFYEMFGDPIENPKGWEVKKLGEVCTDVKYGTSKPACEGGRYKYLRMNNLTADGHLDLSNLKYIDIPDSEVEKCIVRKGDVLFNRTNSIDLVGKTCEFTLEEPMVIAGYIIRVRLSDEVLPTFVSICFNTKAYKKLLKSIAKGAVNQANINSKELQALEIPLPPLSLQQSFAEKIRAIESQKSAIKQSLVEVETLLASRMDYYFN